MEACLSRVGYIKSSMCLLFSPYFKHCNLFWDLHSAVVRERDVVPSAAWQVSMESQRILEITEQLLTPIRNTLALFKQLENMAK